MQPTLDSQQHVTRYFQSTAPYWKALYADDRLLPTIYQDRHAAVLGWLQDLDLHAKQRCSESLALRVGAERDRPTTPEGAVEKKVQRTEVRQLEPFDRSVEQVAEVGTDAVGGDFAEEDRVVLEVERDDANVASIAFVAGAGVGQGGEGDLHATASV